MPSFGVSKCIFVLKNALDMETDFSQQGGWSLPPARLSPWFCQNDLLASN